MPRIATAAEGGGGLPKQAPGALRNPLGTVTGTWQERGVLHSQEGCTCGYQTHPSPNLGKLGFQG